ncbi:Uncharacterised protein [Neisseria animalis]|nr:Uncharacterised protein [Neisseria animalis]
MPCGRNWACSGDFCYKGRLQNQICRRPETLVKTGNKPKLRVGSGFTPARKLNKHLERYHFKKPKQAGVKPAPTSLVMNGAKAPALLRIQQANQRQRKTGGKSIPLHLPSCSHPARLGARCVNVPFPARLGSAPPPAIRAWRCSRRPAARFRRETGGFVRRATGHNR